MTDSHEHDEHGIMADDAATRVKMHQKRLRKIERIRATNPGPESFAQGECKRVIVGWGSTREILFETAHRLSLEGENTAVVHFDEIWPFPQQAAKLFLNDNSKTVVVENNATGQLAKLIAAYTGYNEMQRILRYDGRPFMVDELVEQIKGS